MTCRDTFARFALSALILLAFSLKSAIPVGFMPYAGGDARVAMVICTGSGPATIRVPAEKTPFKHAPATKAHGADTCAFAGVLTTDFTPDINIDLPDFATASQLTANYSFYIPSISFTAYAPRGPPIHLLQSA